MASLAVPDTKKGASRGMAIAAFTIVYLVWGSTYFFIRKALGGFPPLLLGGIRFVTAGLFMMGWCLLRKEKLLDRSALRTAAVSGFFILFIGNGTVIWVEQYVPSAWVAIIISSAPLWFVLLDKRNRSASLSNRSTVLGLIIGFAGILLLFSEELFGNGSAVNAHQAIFLVMITLSSISWVAGSLYAKYREPAPPALPTTTWQMVFAGLYFFIFSFLRKEYHGFRFSEASPDAWLSLAYLVFFGSILGYSCYVWLINNQPSAQVSTYAYVNPVVAVLLGVFFGAEHITLIQVGGLAVILLSVLLVNLNKYRKKAMA
jgi:drug/metabolite transporter (DMT)-like permease